MWYCKNILYIIAVFEKKVCKMVMAWNENKFCLKAYTIMDFINEHWCMQIGMDLMFSIDWFSSWQHASSWKLFVNE